MLGSRIGGPGDGPRNLPLRAEALLKILVRYRGKNSHCWPSQELLATELGIKLRQVKYWLAYLDGAGMIEIERTGRRNNYWIPPRPDPETGPDTDHIRGAEIRTSEVRKSAHQRCGNPHLLGVAPLDEFNSAAASASAAAAADVEITNADHAIINGLVEIGMPAIVRSLAEKNATLAIAILEHCRWRFSDQRGLASIGNRAGYIIACFRKPEDVGFMQDDGGVWHVPPGQPRRLPAMSAEHPRVDAWLANIKAYDGLDKVTQQMIQDFVRNRAPLFASVSEGHSAFRMECVGVMVQWRKDGKLDVDNDSSTETNPNG